MPVQYNMVVRPIAYLLAIIIFWRMAKRTSDNYWRLTAVMVSLFIVTVVISIHEAAVGENHVILIAGRSLPYLAVRAVLENLGLFAIVASLLFLLTKRLDTAARNVRQLARITESSADAIIAFDSTGTITNWNHGAELVFAYFPEEILGQKITVLIPEEFQDEFERAADRCRAEGFVRGLSCRMVGKGRKRTLAEVTLSVITDDDGAPTGMSVFVRDITEQKEMEKDLLHASKMTAMGAMAAGVVQEFGNLLTVISARAQLGVETGAIDEAHEEFEAIASCAGRAKSVTGNLLSYAQRQPPRKQVGRVAQAADAAILLLEKELERANVTVRRNYEEVPQTAFDREQIVHVFVNIIINALNAMSEAGGNIEVEIRRRQEYIEITLRDDGPGIAPDVIGTLFEPFSNDLSNAQSSTRRGLGLYVCRQIVKFHNGNIAVESRRNKGTAFRIYLPVTLAAEPPVVRADTAAPAGAESLVAVVDSDSMIRDLLVQAMERRGVSAKAFQSAAAAEAEGVKGKFDVIFADVSIRTASGERYIDQLKGDRGLLVVAMIGEAVGGDELQEIEKGSADILRKPFGLDEIYAICDFIQAKGRGGQKPADTKAA